MKKYEYERVRYEGVLTSKLETHREVIDRRAAEGWRYVDSISIHETNNGAPIAVDLVFEKDAKESE